MATTSRARGHNDRKSREVQKLETKVAELYDQVEATAKLAIQTSLDFSDHRAVLLGGP